MLSSFITSLPLLAIGLFSSTSLASDDCVPVTWKRSTLAPGDVNCRLWRPTGPKVTSETCSKLAESWDLSMDKFLELNPSLGKDCKSIQAETKYCVRGFFEPLRAWDGLCGPKHDNATCSGTAHQCCNSKTWTCGEREEDCRPGICYEGACLHD